MLAENVRTRKPNTRILLTFAANYSLVICALCTYNFLIDYILREIIMDMNIRPRTDAEIADLAKTDQAERQQSDNDFDLPKCQMRSGDPRLDGREGCQ